MKRKIAVLCSFALILITLFWSCEEENLKSLAVLTTTEATGLSASTVISGGNITDNGGAEIIARGVCLNTGGNPTIADIHTSDSSGTGIFISNLVELDVNTTYYLCAYATNSEGTAYGNEINFTTKAGMPNITTTEISNITATTATSGGNIIDDSGFTITARGICWSKDQNPTLANVHTTDSTGTGSFTSNLTDLSIWTTYYVRSYATNANGTSYGNEISFISKNTITDYDGNIYKIVTIGNQTWMAENLKTTHYANSTEIQVVEDPTSWYALECTDKAMCYYNNSTANADIYGALYTWAAAMNGAESSSTNPSSIQGVCPTGWHLPSDGEWVELTDYLGGISVAGGKMKETDTTHWLSPNAGATNESGFTSLPSGRRGSNSTFAKLGISAYFWSATRYGSSRAWNRNLYNNTIDVSRYNSYRYYGFSVRCLKD